MVGLINQFEQQKKIVVKNLTKTNSKKKKEKKEDEENEKLKTKVFSIDHNKMRPVL